MIWKESNGMKEHGTRKEHGRKLDGRKFKEQGRKVSFFLSFPLHENLIR